MYTHEHRIAIGLLTKNSRDRLAEQIGVKETAMRNQITRLCQKEIFRRIGTGEFEANPNLFARSAWSDIHNDENVSS
ncbi:hypothetical protein [Legionella bozemanae]|uniref:Uncharacterized protein n=1 Tax=Legionella bozemanae TaxID=447 RepID=A0A0W0RJL6_LEGBO|nr:hypothetical protein [Legionella bozemanae]KTC71221.1 hypothetical protein Lboz_2798 [Legionella bozemanae]STO33357.1 Uncharacterised protein [Legionella bozemanae]